MKMKMLLITTTLLLFTSCRVTEDISSNEEESFQYSTCSGSLLLEGKFQGKNLYVQNPMRDSAFCVCSITINDTQQLNLEEYNSSAFEINLIGMELKIGADVKIQMKHYGDCKPKVLNPAVH